MLTNKLHSQTLLLATFFLALLAFGVPDTFAQDAEPSPSSDSAEVTRLKEQKAQAELRKAIAEARKAELEARFPASDAKTLEGKTTVADSGRVEE